MTLALFGLLALILTLQVVLLVPKPEPPSTGLTAQQVRFELVKDMLAQRRALWEIDKIVDPLTKLVLHGSTPVDKS